MDKDQYLVDAILDVPLRVIVAAKLLRWLRARHIDKPVSVDAEKYLRKRAAIAGVIAEPYLLTEIMPFVEEKIYQLILQHALDRRLELDRFRYLGITEVGFVPRAKK